ncbi:MAG: bifunctional tetrahydrofolate synthase/dihydrofolate synthase [Pseudomonadota bacterium]
MFHADNLEAWLDRLESSHPKGQGGIELGLERVGEVLRAMGLTSRLPFPVITVGGTNGKGSSVAFLEAVLSAAGHRVGAYTSPHLLRYNERVRLNGVEAEDALLVHGFEHVEEARGDVPLTYFEFGTLAALAVFVEARVDVAILEVGLGGRLDAVNIIDADAALLTNVSLDHVEWLGEDREAIGVEKAGIFRRGQIAVIAEREPPRSVLAQAEGLLLRPLRRGVDFEARLTGDGWSWQGAGTAFRLPLPALSGAHQIDNAAGALMVLTAMRERLPWGDDDLRRGLLSARHPGRMQCMDVGAVRVCLDVAHNPAGVEVLARTLAADPPAGRTLAVFAALADKDALAMARGLSDWVTAWYIAGLDGPRGRKAEALSSILQAADLPVAACLGTPRMAYTSALADARPGDRLIVFGSFLCVADVLAALRDSDIEA